MRKFLPALLALALVSNAAHSEEAKVHAYWLQVGPGGVAEMRTVTGGNQCPVLHIDAAETPMTPRAAASQAFPLVCSAPVPSSARSASLGGEPAIPLPKANPQRIVVLGDTGCRIKGNVAQACNDPQQWPFATLAASAARLKPDLVLHVGDYLYRENACPVSAPGCAGTPWGDNWQTWAADFFTPAAPLLSAAPWVFVRGNHEECARAGHGFLRLLGPGTFDENCTDHLAPFAVPESEMNLVVWDDAVAPDTELAKDLLPGYQSDFAGLATIAPRPIWLLMHRPIWAAAITRLGVPAGGNRTMIEAAGDQSTLAPVTLMLAGHVHSFEALNYQTRTHAALPPQIVAGHGGDNLDPQASNLAGTMFQGLSGVGVKDGMAVGGFGFLLMTKSVKGWTVDLYKVDGTTEGQCQFEAGRVDCKRD